MMGKLNLVSMIAGLAAAVSVLYAVVCLSFLPGIWYQQRMASQCLQLLQRQPRQVTRSVLLPEAALPQRAFVYRQSEKNIAEDPAWGRDIRVMGISTGVVPLVFLEFSQEKPGSLFRVHDRIGPLEICAIKERCVIISNGSNKKVFELSRFQSDAPLFQTLSSNEIVFSKNSLAPAILRIAGEANAVKVVPVQGGENGSIDGVRIKNIPREGLILKIGFQNNDIIKRINGIPVDSIDTIVKIVRTIKAEKAIAIAINRNNSSLVLNYYIKE
jgi:hypothetical protein